MVNGGVDDVCGGRRNRSYVGRGEVAGDVRHGLGSSGTDPVRWCNTSIVWRNLVDGSWFKMPLLGACAVEDEEDG